MNVLILSEKELLERVAAAGYDIPPSRFAKWREKGMVPTLGRPGQGQGKGRAAHTYSEAAVEQTLQIARMRAENFDLDEIGWRLWLDGYDIDRRWWSNVFDFMAKQFDDCASAFRKAQQSDEFAETQIDRMVAESLKAKTSNRFIKRIRKSLGSKRFAAFMNEVANMATGTFEAISSQEVLERKDSVDDSRARVIGLGLAHSQGDTVNGVGPIIDGNYTTILQETFAPLKDLSLVEFLDSIDPEELRRVTKSMIDLLNSIDAASEAFDRVYARDAFGLRRAAMMARADRNIHAGAGLVWVLVQQRSTEEFYELDAMSKLFLNAAIGARKLLETGEFDANKGRLKFQRKALKNRSK